MTLYRVFLALSLPAEAKEELLAQREKLEGLPARWTRYENLHVTLLFLGNRSEQEIEKLSSTVQETAGRHHPFSFTLSAVEPGPANKEPAMVWATGETPQELQALRNDMEQALQPADAKPFSLHVTLARLKQWEYRALPEDERPEIAGELSLTVPVSSIEIMESKLTRAGADYTLIQSIPL